VRRVKPYLTSILINPSAFTIGRGDLIKLMFIDFEPRRDKGDDFFYQY